MNLIRVKKYLDCHFPLHFATQRAPKGNETITFYPLQKIGDEIDLFRLITDSTTYWTQIMFMLAIAIERYILIVTGHKAKSLLSHKRRLCFYVITVLFSVSVPLLYIVDFLVHTYKLDNPSLESK